MILLYQWHIITLIVGGQMTTLKGEAIDYSGTPLHKDGLVASVSVDHKALLKKLPVWDPDQHWVTQTQPFIVSSLWVIQSNGFWAGSNMAVNWTTVALNTHSEMHKYLQQGELVHIMRTHTDMLTPNLPLPFITIIPVWNAQLLRLKLKPITTLNETRVFLSSMSLNSSVKTFDMRLFGNISVISLLATGSHHPSPLDHEVTSHSLLFSNAKKIYYIWEDGGSNAWWPSHVMVKARSS